MPIPPVPTGLERAAGWSWRLLVCAAAAFAVLALLAYLDVIVLPALVAITIAPALTPLARVLRARGFGRAAPAIALVTGLLVLAALVTIVTASISASYEDLQASARQGYEDVLERLEEPPFNLSLEQQRDVGASLQRAWRGGATYVVSGARSTASVVAGLLLAVILLFFILRDGRAFWDGIVRRFPAASRASVDRAGERAWYVLGGFVRGTALIAAIDATLIGIGLWILGVPLVFALAVLIFLGSFIPFVGATITGLVAVLVALADGGLTTALLALAIVLGVQFLEGNFLQPVIQSRTVDLHPVVIVLAVAAGGSLYGILGAYLAVPVTAVAVAVLASLEAEGLLPEVVPVETIEDRTAQTTPSG